MVSGDRIAWAGYRQDAHVVRVADADGAVVQTFDSQGYDPVPVWSPDGSLLAWTPEYGGAQLADPASGELRRLSLRGGQATDVGWAPSGSEIVAGHANFSGEQPALEVIGSAEGSTSRLFEGPLLKAHSVSWQPVERVHRCRGIQATIIGTPGDDVLEGGVGNDVVVGLDGNDELATHSGVDTVCAGGGDDVVRVGSSPVTGTWGNVAVGGPGNDVIHGGPAWDQLFGGPGDDRLYGRGGHDLIRGGGGNDRLVGNRGGTTSTGVARTTCSWEVPTGTISSAVAAVTS